MVDSVKKQGNIMLNFMQQKIQDTKKQLLELGDFTKQSLNLCQQSFLNFDYSIAEKVINRDGYVDEQEVAIEEAIIRYISLYQPVAMDLRLVIAMLKINHDLERIHDSIVNLCQTTCALKLEKQNNIPEEFNELFNMIIIILDETLDSFFNVDSEKALNVCLKIKNLKKIKNKIFNKIQKILHNTSDEAEGILHITFSLKNAYRIGKYAINIAEDVYYLKKGQIIRHHHPEIEKA